MTQQQTPFGRPGGPQFSSPYGQNAGQSSFGGWGGGQQQWQGPQFQQGQWPQQPQGQWPQPGQFGTPGPAPKQKRPLGLIIATGAAVVVLAALLAYTLFGRPSAPGEVVPEYQNEDYQVPTAGAEVPQVLIPDDTTQRREFLEENAIYEASLAEPVRCELTMVDDVHDMTDETLQARLADYISCLTRAWGPTLDAAGFVSYNPQFTIYPSGGTVQTQCGTQESMNAFYCAADQNIYLARDILRVLSPDLAADRAVYELIIAHEYGHAMQGRTGIIISANWLAMDEKDELKMLEHQRRTEVQADCFAGLALRSLGQSLELTDADREAILAISRDIGDDVLADRFGADPTKPGNHGTGDSRRLWADRGISTNDIGSCNTYLAPSDEVR